MSSDPTPTVWTVRNLLTWTAKHFAAKGIDDPAKEARLLLGHVLGCRPIDVLTRYDDQPTDAERQQFRELIKRRTDGCPVAYLAGTKDFYLLTFDVTPAVLIPRPDTETLVQAGVDFLKGKPTPAVLDLGTGSGCVAVSIAHQVKTARVTAVDVSADAAAVAQRNVDRHGLTDRVTVHTGDLFAPLPAGARYDLIVSNPPYIAASEIETLDVGVRQFEPRLALDGGEDGLQFYLRLAPVVAARLKPGGRVMVEVGWTQDAAVRELFTAAGLTVLPSLKDMAGRWRVVRAMAGERGEAVLQESGLPARTMSVPRAGDSPSA
jgi:release factor glutamine methyltransferase